MEWEEVGREEKLERVRRKKEHWEVTRIARALTVELLEVAVAWTEERSMRELVDEIILEGWRKLETENIIRMILDADGEV